MTTDNQQETGEMNGFEMHGIERLSPSQVNKAREGFDAWFVEKILGFRFPSGVAAHRGTATEAGVSAGLFDDKTDDEAVEAALAVYDNLTKLEPYDAAQVMKERGNIEVMVRDALGELRPLGKPARPPEGMQQHMVELQCRFASGEKGTIKYIGYLDFVFPEHNLIVDLKTTSRLPSSFSSSHAIQAAFYKQASGGKRVRFLYVSPKKTMPRFTWLEMDDPTPHLQIIKMVTARMEGFLRLSPDKDTLAKAVVPNLDSFYWTNADHIAEAVFGVTRIPKAEVSES